jgi:2Fe-2S ferredoxin
MRDGEAHVLTAEADRTVMETIRDAGIDELQALCGGCCSCATCHVFIQEDYMRLLPSMNEDENDLLDGSEHRQEGSRLSCQIRITDSLNRIVVQIAPED